MIEKLKNTRPEVIISNILRLLLIASIIDSFFNHNFFNLFTGVVTFLITYLPYIIQRKNHIILPSSVQIIILLFIFTANYLGDIQSFYERFWWWDKMLHTLSGVILGFIGFLLVFILNKEKKVSVELSPAFMAVFALSFAVFMGTLWEIYEFSMDFLLGFNMQGGSLYDTMWDLIVDTLGAIIACFYGYAYEKHNMNGLFKDLMTKFMKLNPRIFRDMINIRKDVN